MALTAGFGRFGAVFQFWAQTCALAPGLPGDYLRVAYYRLTLDEFTNTRNHGIDPEYVNGLSTLGYKNLTVEALVRARDHGVDPEYIRGMADVGYKGVPMDALIRMRDHGVDPAFVRRVQQRGL